MENIKSYLDGELDLAQQAEVETHLRNDADMQKMVEEFSAISATLKTADAGEPYGLDKLTERLATADDDRKVSDSRIWRIAATWSGMAVCLGLLAVIFFPVFAQSKEAAKKSSALALAKKRGIESEMADLAVPQKKMGNPNETSGDASASSAVPTDQSAGTIKKNDEAAWRVQSGNEVPPNLSKGSDGEPLSDQSKAEQMRPMTPGDAPGGSAGGAQASPNTKSGTAGEIPGGGSVYKSSVDDSVSAHKLSGKESFGKSVGGVRSKTAAGRASENAASGKNPKAAGDLAFGATPATPESQFKREMRGIRNQQVQSSNTLNDTPHGIYLERSGEIQVKVEDLMRSVDETTGMVQSLDGYVVNHGLQNEAEGGEATMVVKVPTKNYNTAMNKLQGMGEVIKVNSSSNDITTETVDNSARMISWADEEKSLMDELAKSKDENHKWRIRQQLAVVRANLAAQREVVKSLKERAEYSTINITFLRGDRAEKVGGPTNWSSNAFRDAKSGLGSVGQILGVIAIYTAVFSPVWLPFVIAALIIRKRNQG